MGKKTGGKIGQPRKSLAEKQKTGSIHSTREKGYAAAEVKIVHLPGVPLPEAPPAPEGLGPEGRQHWDVVARELGKLRVLSAVDLFNLRALCIEWECYLEHRQEQKTHKSYYAVKGDDGKTKSWQPHPAHYNGTNHLREYTRLCQQFGLNPAARASIGINAQEQTTSRAAALLKKAV